MNDEALRPNRSPYVVVASILISGLIMFAVGFLVGQQRVDAATSVVESQPLTVTREVVVTAVVTQEVIVTRIAEVEVNETPVVDVNSALEPVLPTPLATEEAVLPPNETASDIDLDLFFETWRLIEGNYDGEIPSDEDLLQSALAGSVETLGDPFTRYIRPDLAARLREDLGGSVSGIGAFVRENEDGFFEIVRPIDGQPADLAGLEGGDIVIAIDDESTDGFLFDELILRVRGPEGTTVKLTIFREGETAPLDFEVVRARFEIPVIESRLLDEGIAYIRLTEFNRNAEARLIEALNEMLPQEPVGLIFDLRDNPGGFLDQSVAVADLFLPQGTVLFQRNKQGLDRTFSSETGDIGESIPLVVLVNPGSASASEIVAGAIQDNDRGTIIGETSFGKGSVQTIYQLSDGSELRVTIARWYTPDDNTIDGEGITPDVIIETPRDLGGDDDGQLQEAIEFLLGQ